MGPPPDCGMDMGEAPFVRDHSGARGMGRIQPRVNEEQSVRK